MEAVLDGFGRKEPQMQDPAFRTLLYRYFFFAWLFKDVNRGTVFERAAALRYNREHAHWLLTYMRRWLWCGLVLYALGGLLELGLNAPALSIVFYIPGALSVSVNAVIGAAWLGLKALPASF
jgi:hypothetical protein